MNTDPIIKLSAIRSELESRTAEANWDAYYQQVRALSPLWVTMTQEWARRIGKDAAKHLVVMTKAFQFMDDWRYERIKLIKARRNEIDSAISFIRNAGHQKAISSLAMAPVGRNLAGALRMSLHIATGNYPDNESDVIAKEVYALAEVRTLFRIDTDNLIQFLPAGLSLAHGRDDLDNYHIMMTEAAKALDMEVEIAAINAEAASIWESFDSPKKFDLSTIDWNAAGGEHSLELYFEGMRAFHDRDG